jgi:GGDEF domain-containing protein
MAPQELLVLLPETPQAGARKFSSRIKQQALDFKPTLFGLEDTSGPFLVLKTGILYYDGNTELKTDAFFQQLEESMQQNL